MNKLCIFDFDGTLADTLTDVVKCLNKALIKNGLPTCKREYIESAEGCRLETMVERHLYFCHKNIDLTQTVVRDYVSIYSASAKPDTKPYAGMAELLAALKEKGCLLAVNSNKNHESLCKLVTELFSKRLFSLVVGNNDIFPTKPDAYGVNFICKKLNVMKNNAVYIGDTQSDVDTAKNAEVPCIIVKWGNGRFNNESNDNNIFIVNNTCELYYKITDLFREEY